MQHSGESIPVQAKSPGMWGAAHLALDRALLVALAIGLLNGLIYIFLLPPWQHYDEPNHFEVAWLIAKRNHLPTTAEYSPALNRRTLTSMLDLGFFDGMAGQPGTPQPGEDVLMPGHSQVGEQPLYYLLAALPLKFTRQASIAHQLMAARLVSLMLYLLTILAGWGIARELTRPGHPLTAALPVCLALLPPFTDLMTAVNNDVAATAFFTLFLWGSVRLLRRGISAAGLIWTLAAALLAYFSKTTAALAIPLLPLVWLLAALPPARRKWVWAAAALVALAGVLLFVRREDAAFFLRSSAQPEPGRLPQANAPLGEWIFLVDSDAPVTPNFIAPFFQPLPPAAAQELAGQVATLGVWMWSDAPVEVRSPTLGTGQGEFFRMVTLTQTPTFFSLQAPLPVNVGHVWIGLDPLGYLGAPRGRIYYDGLLLVKGAHPSGDPPESITADAAAGVWDGANFTNLVRNGSAEAPGLRVHPRLDQWGAAFLPDRTRPSLILASVVDPRGVGWYYRLSAARLLQTFWGVFAWGHVALPAWVTTLMGWLSGLGLLGLALACLVYRRQIPWSAALVLGLACALAWGMALVRGPIYLSKMNIFLPNARYAFPVVAPTLAALLAGWFCLVRLTLPRPGQAGRIFQAAVFVLFLALNLFSIFIIYRYYWV